MKAIFADFIVHMTEGDPLAIYAVAEMLTYDSQKAVRVLRVLDRVGVRGIVLANFYMDCRFDVEKVFSKRKDPYSQK